MALVPSSLAAASAAGGDGFVSQGSLDWVALSNTTYSASISILKRVSAEGVDSLTLVVGQALCSSYQLSIDGHKRFDEAISKLASFSTFGKVAWFGFGIQHITRDLAETEQGQNLLVIAGCLADTCGARVASMILAALTRQMNAPSDMRPSAHQWTSLVEACSGVFAPTQFSRIVDHFIGYGYKSLSSGGKGRGNKKRWMDFSTTSHFDDVATALGLIQQLCSGELRSLKIGGGAACGIIAAIAYWFFGITVRIEASDGQELFTSSVDQFTTTLTVVYSEDCAKVSEPTPIPLEITHRTFVLRSAKDIFQIEDNISDQIYGRIPWSSILSEMFPSETEFLKDPDSAIMLGQLVASTARLFEFMAMGDEDVVTDFSEFTDELGKQRLRPAHQIRPSNLVSWSGYAPSQYGEGLMEFLAWRFPEISSGLKIRPNISFLAVDSLTAIRNYIQAFDGLNDVWEEKRKGKSPGDENTVLVQPTTISHFVGALIHIGRHLASIKCESINPTRQGFEQMIQAFFGIGVGKDMGHIKPKQYLFSGREPPVGEHYQALYCLSALLGQEKYKNPILPEVINENLKMGLSLFAPAVLTNAPYLEKIVKTGVAAISIDGVCFYWGILEELTDNPGKAMELHIAPGHIHLKGSGRRVSRISDNMFVRLQKLYDQHGVRMVGGEDEFYKHCFFDDKVTIPPPVRLDYPDSLDWPLEVEKQEELIPFAPTQRQDGWARSRARLVIEEGFDDCSVVYELYDRQGKTGMLRVGPSVLRCRIIMASGRLDNCGNGKNCRPCDMEEAHHSDDANGYGSAEEDSDTLLDEDYYTDDSNSVYHSGEEEAPSTAATADSNDSEDEFRSDEEFEWEHEVESSTKQSNTIIKWNKEQLRRESENIVAFMVSGEGNLQDVYKQIAAQGSTGGRKGVVIFRNMGNDPISRCLGLFGFRNKTHYEDNEASRFACYLRNGECHVCCMRSVIQRGRFPAVVVI
ncbi:hypothetical protein BJ508DRAFT_419651 [Ascobolus immersus RN42]|uniref:Uncharacterized protein n=1 Tax=Ascobolus immersus RN42 TaxID=1160509 RepID=A0A3N4HES2_ASCIM|nr:hypothetical protein BJ508DRAFT_419651 [Ascobolus immersus RN42]